MVRIVRIRLMAMMMIRIVRILIAMMIPMIRIMILAIMSEWSAFLMPAGFALAGFSYTL